MDRGERLVGMAFGKSCLDKKLAEEDHDFFELGICLVGRTGYRPKVGSETCMLE